ncbi:NAD(P)-binding domain-containing protein [Paenibacillus donghaensis]|uniref:Pyrroline-5-carboxylate reductase catalytic N-terminal domain-containing protein n=1 Tax=Paenibacillus donghaensis TaxID=414771 RepID=A0A2Z2KMC7_9BACL|nr:NAD(P)-binding domain-containing protein [Paenibacillus donghaensis]ASA19788.1 hypothetical protein B9T62_02570 [Paenibacillus donghaensis]
MKNSSEFTGPSLISKMNLCFIGAGSIAQAINQGITDNHLVNGDQLSIINRSNIERLQFLHREYGVQTILQDCTVDDLIQKADIIIVC